MLCVAERFSLQQNAVGAPDVGLGFDLGDQMLRHGLVDGQHHHRLAAWRLTTHMHRRDVDITLAEQRAGRTV